MVRKATPDDIERLLQFARRFHPLSPYAHEAFDVGKVSQYLKGFFNRSDARIFISTNGAIGMTIDHTEVYQRPYVRERFMYAERGAGARLRDMLDAFADVNGGIPITLFALSHDGKDTKAQTRLYARQGYRVAETTYVKGL